jgi:hypothetical protein
MMNRLEALQRAVLLVKRFENVAATSSYHLDANSTTSEGYGTDVNDAALP